MKLYNIFEKLILEDVNRSEVIKAIDSRYRVNIDYMGDEETESGKRTIEVYAFGLSKSGNLVIRAYQGFGKTTTVIPGWKMFRLDRINRWEPINIKKGIFNSPISDRTNVPDFNPNGDKMMSTVYKVVQFNNNNNSQI